MISGDSNLLKEGSVAHGRLALQRSAVEQLDVFVWPSAHSKWQIWRAARKNRYDVVTSQDPFWRGLLAWKIARLTDTKLNVQVHADLTDAPFLKRLMARFVLRRADSIRAVSDRVKKQVEGMGAHAPVHVLPVFIDLEPFRRLVRQPGTQKTILWIGRFETEKDPCNAISVLKEVRKEIDAKLIMLGSGTLEACVKKDAAGLPAMPDGRPRVEFPGWQDPKPYLAAADIVISTSRAESFGASTIEALAAGVPVVAPDVGVAKEAGAQVVPRDRMAAAVVTVLMSGTRGVLRLPFPNAEAWAASWRDTLS